MDGHYRGELSFSFHGNIIQVVRHLDRCLLNRKAYAMEVCSETETTRYPFEFEKSMPELPAPSDGRGLWFRYTLEWRPYRGLANALLHRLLALTVEPPPDIVTSEAVIALLEAHQEEPVKTVVSIGFLSDCYWEPLLFDWTWYPDKTSENRNQLPRVDWFLVVDVMEFIKHAWAICIDTWETTRENRAGERNYGATEKVRELAEAVKKLKDAEPTRSMMDIAMALGTTPDAIRYAYRSVGWKWERADRVRVNR